MGFKARGAIAMLDASHRRQEERLAEGRQAIETLAAGRGGDAEHAVVAEVLAFLRKQARRHIADEEESVFPRLRARSTGTLQPGATILALEGQHRAHEGMLDLLERGFQDLVNRRPDRAAGTSRPSSSSLSAPQAAEFADLFVLMEDHYRAHIALEDRELLPAMRRDLTAADLVAISDEMLARRGPRGEGGRGQGQGRGQGRGQGQGRRRA